MQVVLLKKWLQFCLPLPYCKQLHMIPLPFDLQEKTKIFKLLASKMMHSFADLKLPSSIAGSIKPCEYFPVACIISQFLFLDFIFLNMLSLRRSHL